MEPRLQHCVNMRDGAQTPALCKKPGVRRVPVTGKWGCRDKANFRDFLGSQCSPNKKLQVQREIPSQRSKMTKAKPRSLMCTDKWMHPYVHILI